MVRPRDPAVYADFFQNAISDYQIQFAEMVKPDDQGGSATKTDIRYANTSAMSDHFGRLHDDNHDHA
jgi:hypothetical protein